MKPKQEQPEQAVTVCNTEFDPEQEVYVVSISTKQGKSGTRHVARITGPRRVFWVAVCQMLLPSAGKNAAPIVVFREEYWLHGTANAKALAAVLPVLEAAMRGDPKDAGAEAPNDELKVPDPDVCWQTNEPPTQRLAASREAAKVLAQQMLMDLLAPGPTGTEE